MQLVIVAGGFGTRLRPLTLQRPKALVPLLNRPQVLYLFDRLPDSVDHVIVAVNYGYAQLRDFFRSADVGRNVTVVEEETPLGTAGALKNVEGHIGGTFAAMNGDVIDSLDLEAFHRFHRRHGTIASLAVWRVDDPTGFGVVALEGARVTSFVEKPKREDAPSNLVNAGRYIFEPEVLDFIPAGREVSLEKEVFPKLVIEGLHAFRYSGFWSDAGTLSTFLHAQAVLLEAGRAHVADDADVARATVHAPVLVAGGCFVEGRLGPHAVLGPGCRIGRASVRDAALLDHVSVDDKAEISRSIIGAGASIGEGAVLEDTIVGDGVHVAPHARLVGARVSG
ncbi:MAG: hypothetical protein A3K66_04755 [Euryarchaeota archaeon RBG_16_67_27]|nr:MAG: hypothetical protein A3K66_04755 [Euryarchaeota archaeon RBG_16_67_27]